jgi:hypothetical protein
LATAKRIALKGTTADYASLSAQRAPQLHRRIIVLPRRHLDVIVGGAVTGGTTFHRRDARC